MIDFKNKRGRPSKNVTWPSGFFTVEDAIQNNSSLSKHTVISKLNRAVKENVLIKGPKTLINGKAKLTFGVFNLNNIASLEPVENTKVSLQTVN